MRISRYAETDTMCQTLENGAYVGQQQDMHTTLTTALHEDESDLVKSLVERVSQLERDYGRLNQHILQQMREISDLEHERVALQCQLHALRARARLQPIGSPLDQRGGRWIVALMLQMLILARRGGELEGELAMRDAELRRAATKHRELRDAQRALLSLSVVAFIIGLAIGIIITQGI
jgi:hypothetical protein